MPERYIGDKDASFTAVSPVDVTLFPDLHSNSIIEWNQRNIDEILLRQQQSEQGCFFVALYMLSNAVYPDRALPEVTPFWGSLRSRYGHLLEQHRLMVPNKKIDQGFEEIYRQEWGIALNGYRLNTTGAEIIGRHMSGWGEPRAVRPGYNSVSTADIPLPYSLLLHQAGGSDTHFITDDGSENVKRMRAEYEEQKYRNIAVFEFVPEAAELKEQSLALEYA